MNKPYVKQFSETGELLNPINGFYPGKTFLGNDINDKPIFFPNRKERRFKSKLGNNRKVTKGRLHFKQVISANTVFKTVKDENGNLVKKEFNYPQKTIIHIKNPN